MFFGTPCTCTADGSSCDTNVSILLSIISIKNEKLLNLNHYLGAYLGCLGSSGFVIFRLVAYLAFAECDLFKTLIYISNIYIRLLTHVYINFSRPGHQIELL